MTPKVSHQGMLFPMLEFDSSWTSLLALFLAGSVAGILNVVAGGGSFLTLPVLLYLGLPTTVANATNRVGILFQNVGAVVSFRRHGVLDWRWTARAAFPAVAGAVLGVYLALHTPEAGFRRILASLMIVISLWTLWDPLRRQGNRKPRLADNRLLLGIGFFLAGVYGGFVQAGVGFLVLSLTTLAGFDLVRGNAIKVLCILSFTVVALGIFAFDGQVAWVPGLVLATGTVLGGQIGVRISIVKGHKWLRGIVTTAVLAMAIHLWITSFW